jgi:hypothetical protein
MEEQKVVQISQDNHWDILFSIRVVKISVTNASPAALMVMRAENASSG